MASRRYKHGRVRDPLNQRQVLAARRLLESVTLGPDFSSAVCVSVGAEFWFPEKGHHGVEEKDAATMCRGGVLSTGRRVGECPMRRACLERALDAGGEVTHYGVWAGYTAKRLGRMRKLLTQIRDCVPPKQGVTSAETPSAEEAPHAA